MEWLIELVVQIFGELILQFIFEALAQAGLHVSKHPRKAFNPVLVFIGHGLFGAGAGALSLFVLPHFLLRAHSARIAYLLLAPAALGCAVAAIGSWRAKRGQASVGLDRFSYSYVFAFAFALVRFSFAST